MDIIERIKELIPNGDGYNSEYAHTLQDAIDEIESLRAKMEEAENNAARYKWLRECAMDEWYGDELLDCISSGYSALDVAVDIAIAKQKGAAK